MGRKITVNALFLLIISASAGCADFEMHVKKEARGIKPAVILIGPFENRNMNYDPYVSEELRDSLKFEFFRKGYNAIPVLKNESVSLSESAWAVKSCSENSGDILIRGVISQRESGFLAEREVETVITFRIYGRSGSVLGEGIYHAGKSAGEQSLRRDAAEKFVSEFLKNLEKAD